MNGLTRHQAAVILGTTDQTITNYCKSGLLGYCKGAKNILYVNAEDVEKYKEKLKMTAASERMIELKQAKLKDMRAKLNEEEVKLRDAMLFHAKGYDKDFVVRIITNLYNSGMIVMMRPREKAILCDFIGGMSFKEIGEKYDLSYARIQQIVNKAAERLADAARNSEAMRTNWDLQQENDALRKEIATLREKYSAEENAKILSYDDMRYITTLLQTRLVDYNLSMRALNCLCKKGGMETLGDLLNTPKREVLMIRDFGRKTMSELKDLVESLSLDWRRMDELEADFYVRLDKLRKGVSEWA